MDIPADRNKDLQERFKASLRFDIQMLRKKAERKVYVEDQNFDEYPKWRQDMILRNRALGDDCRLEKALQSCFEYDFYNVHPWRRGFYHGAKQDYIDYALELYPSLKITEEMKMQIRREEKDCFAIYPDFPGTVIYIDDNSELYVIVTKVKRNGSGKLLLHTQKREIYDTKLVSRISEKWDEVISEIRKEEVDVWVGINTVYGMEPDRSAALAVLLSIWGFTQKKKMDGRTILMGRFQERGKKVHMDNFRHRLLDFAKSIGAERICMCNKPFTKNEREAIGDFRIDRCDDIESLKKSLFI